MLFLQCIPKVEKQMRYSTKVYMYMYNSNCVKHVRATAHRTQLRQRRGVWSQDHSSKPHLLLHQRDLYRRSLLEDTTGVCHFNKHNMVHTIIHIQIFQKWPIPQQNQSAAFLLVAWKGILSYQIY